MDYNEGYAWFDHYKITPQYYFGGGMSYTSFKYSNLFVPCSTAIATSVVYVTTDIKNTGTVAGDETAFLFISYPGHTERRHVKDLKGFYRVSLNPGETKRVTFPVRVADLKYWDNSYVDPGGHPNDGWHQASGQFGVLVTGSADPNDPNHLPERSRCSRRALAERA